MPAGFLTRLRRWWRASRTERGEFNHWLQSLVRLYSDGAVAHFEHADSPLTLRATRANGKNSSCELHLGVVLSGGWKSREPLLEEPENPDYQVVAVPNIWSHDAGASAARALVSTLSALGVPHDASFFVSFQGPKSVPLRLEYLRRLKAGEL